MPRNVSRRSGGAVAALDQLLGNLSLEDPNLGTRYLERGRDLSLPLGLDPKRVALGGDWDFLALAQGDVAVPAEGNIKLQVGLEPQPEDFRRMSELYRHWYQDQHRRGPNDLSGLSALGPEDLYRLDVIGIDVPPLRERVADLPILVDHFLAAEAEQFGRRSVSRGHRSLEQRDPVLRRQDHHLSTGRQTVHGKHLFGRQQWNKGTH